VGDRPFERLVHDHTRAVTAFARSLASTPSIAEEAVADTFVRAWRFQDSFRGDGPIEGWLLRICRHCVYDLERRELRHESLRTALEVHSPTTSHSDVVTGEYEVMAAMASLPRHHREVLMLCGVLGYDQEATAQILDVAVGTVRSRLHRARRDFAEILRGDREALSRRRSSA
jgi:RNA polymerase sigma-70 factor (ECF subfamily)